VVESDGDPVGRDRRAVDAAPAVEVGGKREFVGLGPHVDVHLVAGAAQDLGQPAAVAERVEIVGDAGSGAEPLAEIPPPLGDRPDERLGARQVDVGLDEPAARDGPAAGPDVAEDRVEQSRVELFNPLVENGLVVAEDEVPVLVEDVDGVAEGRHRLGRPFFPPPLPDRVQVGVADEVDR
jgi:hypothetical protein